VFLNVLYISDVSEKDISVDITVTNFNLIQICINCWRDSFFALQTLKKTALYTCLNLPYSIYTILAYQCDTKVTNNQVLSKVGVAVSKLKTQGKQPH